MKKFLLSLVTLFLCLSTLSAKTIYCKMEHGWWYSDGAAVAVYTFDGANPVGAAWPGTRMTQVETNIWKAEIADNAPSCIFVRVNGAGDITDWGAKTANLTVPTDGKNLFTITSIEPVWGDPGCTGEWSIYTPTGDNTDKPDNGCQDGPYGILLNDSIVEATPDEDFEGYKQYLAKAYVEVGDTCRLINISCGQTWMVDLNESSVAAFTGDKTTGYLLCTKAGCYDFYIKLKADADQLYIGEGTGCPNEPTEPEKPNPSTQEYYLIGFINGADHGDATDHANLGDYKFAGDPLQLKATFTQTSYVCVKTGDNKTWYMCEEYVDATQSTEASANLTQSSESIKEKMGVPAGKELTFTLVENADGTLTLSFTAEKTSEPEEPEDKPYEPGTYATSVPENCPDVMLQAFYWDSYQSQSKFGDTRWGSLNAQASEIAAYFDLVWLPPSAKSSGGVGYLPRQYSNQNSDWGTRAELETFIATMHAGNTKVIADIVVNHAGNKSTWCDYLVQDFGAYGFFEPDASWITKDDEVWTSGQKNCTPSSAASYDDGMGEPKNYGDARDWDHDNEEVRAMCRAYLKWMKEVMLYDGWRYDYCKGFHESHINDYNTASANYFSVMEWWDGNVNTLRAALERANWNTLTFDFATKYDAFKDGIHKGNYNKLKGAGMLGAGLSKHAVTFIDSHDTFGRSDNQDFMEKSDGSSINDKSKVLQANAYLLSMPGVPCVFYPHWIKYKDNIAKMVLARQATGVHSQSAVSDEAGNDFYKATIQGTNGEIRLLLGPNSGYNTQPEGYTLADKGENYGVYYKINSPVAPRLIITPGSQTFKDNTKGVTVTMSTIAGGATNVIYYTTDGTNPKTSDTRLQYTAPFTIKETTVVKAYAANGSVQTDVQTCTYTYKEPQTTPIIVRFQKPTAWEKVYLYSWTGTAPKETKHTGDWPGTELTVTDSEGWYYYQFDATLKEVNFIFNAGKDKDQTSDLWTDEDVCYKWSGGAEELVEDCQFTGVEDIEIETLSTTRKVLMDGQLYILRDGSVYNVLGIKVK